MAKLTLDKARKRKGLSKREFAKRMGITYRSAFRVFQPGYNPRASQLIAIAAAIKCRVRDLFEE